MGLSQGANNIYQRLNAISFDFGSSRIDTSKKYSARALVLGGSNYFQISNGGEACTLGTGDFTVEFWIYNQNSATLSRLFQSRAGWNIEMGTNKTAFQIGSTYHFDGQTEPPLNEWSHVAFTREGSTLAYWINGIKIAAVGGVSNDLTASDPSAAAYLGTFGTVTPLAFYHTGKVQGFHVVKGVALYDYSKARQSFPKKITSNSNTTLLLDTVGTTVPFTETGPHGYSVSNGGGTSTIEEVQMFDTASQSKHLWNIGSNAYGNIVISGDDRGGTHYEESRYYWQTTSGKPCWAPVSQSITTSKITVATWIRRLGDLSSGAKIFSTNDEHGISYYIDGSFRGFAVDWKGVNKANYAGTNSGFPLNEWCLVVVEMTETTVRTYIRHRQQTGVSYYSNETTTGAGGGLNALITDIYLGGWMDGASIANRAANLEMGSFMLTPETLTSDSHAGTSTGSLGKVVSLGESLWQSQSGRFQ